MTSTRLKMDRKSVSWHIVVGKGQHKGRGIHLAVWLAEVGGEPVEVIITGGGPLTLTVQGFCTALNVIMAARVPMGRILKAFRGHSDELSGPVTGDDFVPECTSIPDYLSRTLMARYPEWSSRMAPEIPPCKHPECSKSAFYEERAGKLFIDRVCAEHRGT